MKKNLIIITLALFSMQVMTAKDIITKDASVLPANAKDFITKHFSMGNISYISMDKEMSGTEYKVRFIDQTKIKFDNNGDWKEIETKTKAVPDKLIPQGIRNYVNQNFPNTNIIQIGKKRYGYDVELSNGLDILFNPEGKVIKVDD